MEKPRDERYEACFRLFLLHNGRNLSLIEREMRALGYADFNRRILYSRKEMGIYKPGWIERYGWNEFQSGVLSLKSKAGNRMSQDAPAQDSRLPTQDFKDWLKSVSPDMTWDWRYQKYIYRHLQKITSGESKRLMIFLPPRHGKSELVTVRYAGWRLWNDPQMRVIVSSYNQRLADKFSRTIRRLLSNEEDNLVQNAEPTMQNAELSEPGAVGTGFPSPKAAGTNCTCGQFADPPQGDRHGARSENSALCIQHSAFTRMFPRTRTINTVSQWETAAGGGVKAVGVGAGVTGFGAQLIIIDDPVKSRADAESETLREKVWDWYRNDLYTRLEPNGSIILIQTRWHEDDLAGRLLNDMADGGDQWDVVNLPALAERSAERSADTPVRMSAKHENKPRPSHNSEQIEHLGHTKIGSPERSADTPVRMSAKHENKPRPSHNSEQIEHLGHTKIGSPERSADTPVRMSAKHENETRPSNNSPDIENRGQPEIGSPEEPAHADKSVRAPADPIGRTEGSALCPERFDVNALEEIQRQLGGYAFSALYQQRPTPAEGGIFKRAWFKRFVSRPPEGLKWKRGYDLAVSTKTSACYTSSFRVAYDDDGNLYIADGFRKRIEFPEQRRYIVSRLLEEKDTEHGIEKALHGQAIIQDLRRDPRIRGSNLRGVTVTTDKLTRALKWSPLAEEGKVILVRGPWNQPFLDEICNFPGNHFDDQIDAVSLAVAMFQDKGKKMYTF